MASRNTAVAVPVSEPAGASPGTAPATPDGGAQMATPYYWEVNQPQQFTAWQKVWHNVHFGFMKAVEGAEVMGEVVADVLGLTDSKYQYVIDALEQERWQKEMQEKAEAEREQIEEAQRLSREEAEERQAAAVVSGVEMGESPSQAEAGGSAGAGAGASAEAGPGAGAGAGVEAGVEAPEAAQI